jgi:hypothetical protein
MADEQRQEPTERTPKGLEVPIPERGSFFDSLAKASVPDYRVWVAVAGMPVVDESSWMPLMERLERDAAAYGPVADWDQNTLRVVLMLPAATDAQASERAYSIVRGALDAVGSDGEVGAIEAEPLPAAATSRT